MKILSPEMTSPIYAHDHDNLSRSVFVIDVDAKPIIASAAWEYVDADESIGTREKTADCSNEAAHATGARKLLEAVNGSQIWTGGCVGASELKKTAEATRNQINAPTATQQIQILGHAVCLCKNK